MRNRSQSCNTVSLQTFENEKQNPTIPTQDIGTESEKQQNLQNENSAKYFTKLYHSSNPQRFTGDLAGSWAKPQKWP